MSPQEFSPVWIALGAMFLPVTGRSSTSSRASGGMLNSTQCVHVPPGASGSSTISAKDCVPAGGSVQARAGEMFLPTHEYFAGMDCPLANASLVSWKVMSASRVGSEVADAQAESRMASTAHTRMLD